MRGIVTKYNEDKGYGFIKGNDGTNLFFHISDIKTSKVPQKGDQLEFESVTGEKGLVAKNVQILEPQKKSGFITFGSVRIKAKNIKSYGLAKCDQTITEKIPEKERDEMRTHLGEGEKVAIKALYTVAAVAEHGVLGLSMLGMNLDEKEPPEYREKTVYDDYLYVTTFQGDNYQFEKHHVSFDIYKKLEEIDNCL